MANSQSSERPDLQDLVAYMQGRGSEALRAQVLKRLDEDEEYLELMMDLVPMLREAGELADPDVAAAAAPQAAEAHTVAPQMVVDAPLPAVGEEPRHAGEALPVLPGKVVALPRPSPSRYGVFAALAALIPIAVAVWMMTRPALPLPVTVAAGMAPIGAADLENGPWKDVTRGGAEPACNSDETACFDAGGQMIDLQVALRQNSEPQVRKLLRYLHFSLGADFARYFPGLTEPSEDEPLDLELVKKKVQSGYRTLLQEQDLMIGFEEGVCLRAALLAARAKDATFFADSQKRKLCLAVVGEADWKPDADALEERFFAVRSGDPDLH